MSKLLIVVSGPDRVGKSTFINKFSYQTGLSADGLYLKHHSQPPLEYENVYDYHMDSVESWLKSEKQIAIFDRSWPCTFILERLREQNTGHFDQLIDFEISLYDLMSEIQGNVLHLGMTKPWHWSAPHHLKELREYYGIDKKRKIRDQYISRMQEHEKYFEELIIFYSQLTMFPHITVGGETPDQIWKTICSDYAVSL